jgi:transcriptional regulator with XRE-family HTH domain
LGSSVPQPPPATPAQLGAAIRSLREARKWTIEGLAAEAEIHWTYLSGIENGKHNPSWVVVNKISRALDVGMGDLAEVAGEQSAG